MPEISDVEPRNQDLRIGGAVGVARLVIGRQSNALLRLRKELADRDAELGPRLQHPRPGAEQRQVLVIGDLDQAIERGIVEHLPPVAVFLLARAD